MEEHAEYVVKPAPAPQGRIAKSLAAAQAKMKNPPKTKTAHAGKYSYRYADLADIIDAVRAPLADAGLAVTQLIEADGPAMALVTTLLHESGESLVSRYPLTRLTSAQDMGSQLTYARRYSLCAILGIAAEDDDDGKAATEAPNPGPQPIDELLERMGAASIGNAAVLRYVSEAGKTVPQGARAVSALEDGVVRWLLEASVWAACVTAAKAPKDGGKRPMESQPDSRKPLEAAQDATGSTAAPPAAEAMAGVDKRLAEAMRGSGVSLEALAAYYVAKGHQPKSVTPDKLPGWYVEKLVQPENWARVVSAIKAAA